jgi:hypothetical protein
MKRNRVRFVMTALFFCQVAVAGTKPAQIAHSSSTTQTAASPLQATSQREVRFVSTTKAGTMERELNQLASEGFRLERVSKSSMGDDLAVLVERDPNAVNAPRYEYKLLSTLRTSTLEKELLQAADQGFELRGLISFLRVGFSTIVQGDETAALMERRLGETNRQYDYKMLSTRREVTMRKELDEAVAAGFTPVEMVLNQENNLANILLRPQMVMTIFLGRRVNAAAGASTREFRFLRTSKVGTMKREMNQAAKEGFRFYNCSPSLLVVMFREHGVKDPAPVQYELLATRRTATMQKELFEHARQGYKYLATSNGLGGLTIFLERDFNAESGKHSHEYRLLATLREKTTQREIIESLAGGYEIVDLTTIGEFIIILDRTRDGRTVTGGPSTAQ